MTHDACSDGRLLALLDGELPESAARETRRHLDACWQCRARMAELEADVHAVARACRAGSWYSPGALERSRRLLHAAIAAEPAARRRPVLWRLAPFAAASLAFAGGAVWYATRPGAVAPRAAAHRVSAPRPASRVVPDAALPQRLPAARAQAPAASQRIDVTAALLDAHEALHRAAVCVREPATVAVENGRIRVRVLAGNAERRAEIVAAAAGPGVDLEVTSMDEPAGAQEQVTFVPGNAPPTPRLRIPLHDEIAARLKPGDEASPAEVIEFADAVLRASEAVNLQHRALLALAGAFPPEVEAKLSTRGRERLTALAASHRSRMADAERILRRALRPLLGDLPAGPEELEAPWQLEARASRTPELHRAITRLFAAPLRGAETGMADARELTPLLARPLTSGAALAQSDLR